MWYSTIKSGLDDMNCVRATVSTDQHSPWFSGHFPGDPILPGVAQLHMVTASIAKVLQRQLVLQSVARIKFKKLIRPGDVLDIRAEATAKENQYSFQITSEQQEVCSGRLVLSTQKEQ